MSFSRRTALKTLTAALGGLGLGSVPKRWPTTAPARQEAGLQQAVVRWPFGDVDLDVFAAAAAEMGLVGIDYLAPEDWPVVEKHGLICTMSQPPEAEGDWNRTADHEALVPAYRERIREVSEAGYPNLMVFSGSRDGISDEEGLENCVQGLKQVVGDAEEHDVTLTIELLNSKVDHEGYMFDRMEWGVELVDRVGSDHLKILYDIYHAQIMEGDVIRTMRDYTDYIGHLHTAGVPGRNEINDTQELNYVGISRAIRELDTDWFLAHEFRPTREDPLESLREAVEICEA
jgi:hydroxypyruvate isomerase